MATESERPSGFADLADLPEDARIEAIARYVRENGGIVGVCVDDVPGKPERYTTKLFNAGCQVVEVSAGPVAGVRTLRVRWNPDVN